MNEPLPIFVYGTLQQGEERSGRWPHPAISIERATIRGRVRDLGPYPALVEGDGVVLGELWTIAPQHLEETLRVLDEIECYGNEAVDLYVRKVVDCQTTDGQTKRAYTYYFADPEAIGQAPYVAENEAGAAHWHRRLDEKMSRGRKRR